MGGAHRRARRGAARLRRPRLLPPSPAHRAPLPAAPAQRARGAHPDREVGQRRRRLDAPVLGADVGDRGRDRRRDGHARRRARPPGRALARRPPRERGGGHARARARTAHARLRLQHAADRQGDRRPAALLPELAGGAQPRQRGQRRVGGGAGRGRARTLRAAATLVSPEGEAARHRPPRRLRPHGAARPGRGGGRLAAGARARARRLQRVLAEPRSARRALLRGALDRRPARARQARRRLLRLHGALRAPLRAAQLHRAAAATS